MLSGGAVSSPLGSKIVGARDLGGGAPGFPARRVGTPMMAFMSNLLRSTSCRSPLLFEATGSSPATVGVTELSAIVSGVGPVQRA